MISIIKKISKLTQDKYAVNPLVIKTLWLSPFILTLVFMILIALPGTRELGIALVQENNVVELATFIIFIGGGIFGLIFSRNLKRQGHGSFTSIFYALFSIMLILIGIEEVSWGQWLVGFETPANIKEINIQGEFNIHNLEGIGGNTEFLRLFFGLAGIFGIWLSTFKSFQKISAPTILLPWFCIIVLLVLPDMYNDYYPGIRALNLFDQLSEVVELLIAVSATCFLWLNSRDRTW